MKFAKKIKTLTLNDSLLNITNNQGANIDILLTDIVKIYLSPKKPSINNWLYCIIISLTIGVLASFFAGLLKAVLIALLFLCIGFKLLSNDKKYILVIKFRKKASFFMQIPTKDKSEIIKLIWEIRGINLKDN